MKLRHLALALAAMAVGVGAPAPALAQKAGDGDSIQIRVCNNSGANARVAISYQPVGAGRFYNEGWYGVAAGACMDLAQTDNAYIYGYAEVENDSTRYWAGNHALCVMYPGPYQFWSDNAVSCAPGQDLRQFVVLHAEDYGVYTWTLDP